MRFFTVMPGLILGKLKSFCRTSYCWKKIKRIYWRYKDIIFWEDDIQSVLIYSGYDIQAFAQMLNIRKAAKDRIILKADARQRRYGIPLNNDKKEMIINNIYQQIAQTYVSAQFSWELYRALGIIATSAENKVLVQESKV